MKICKQCKEPKLNFQMSHITLYAGGSAASAKLNVCKKCMNDIVANIKHGVYIGKLEEINKLIKDL